MGKKITVELYWEDSRPLNRETLGEKLGEVMYTPDGNMFDILKEGDTGFSQWASDDSHYFWEVTETNE